MDEKNEGGLGTHCFIQCTRKKREKHPARWITIGLRRVSYTTTIKKKKRKKNERSSEISHAVLAGLKLLQHVAAVSLILRLYPVVDIGRKLGDKPSKIFNFAICWASKPPPGRS